MKKTYLGLGKTLFNSSAAVIESTAGDDLQIELLLSERLNRKKASGVWPEQVIENLQKKFNLQKAAIAENRDVIHPAKIELFLNKQFPFFEHIQSKNLGLFSSHFNPAVKWLSHHLSHASAATLMSPFEKALIVVMDGAGSSYEDFLEGDPEKHQYPVANYNSQFPHFEECSVYLMDHGELQCVKKNWQVFLKNSKDTKHSFSEGLGSFYEKSAEFIFNDKRAAGKVMGLAAFGKAYEFQKRSLFLEDLDWKQSFQGRSKTDWEESKKFSLYANVAASVQEHFERSVLSLVTELHQKFPAYENLILMGGCALNCTTNMKIYETGFFKSIYVPPFPGDESIGLGCASYLYHQDNQNKWQPRVWEQQHGYFGSTESVPTEEQILKIFEGFEVIRPNSIDEYTAQKISEGAIVGWFQGRSETGPRALGNRSILARVDTHGLKDHLNANVKKRESFRPYGCSVLHEKAHEYFEVPKGFDNPFMSFAVKTRAQFKEAIAQVTHYDGTSRMQTVREKQNPRFHGLISEIGKRTGLACVLNTSLNVMSEPIVETVADAKKFLLNTPVNALAIGDFYIQKKIYDQ